MVGLHQHLLSVTVFLPLVWAIMGLVIPVGNARPSGHGGQGLLKAWTLLGTLVTLGLSLIVYSHFSGETASFEWVENVAWLPSLGISYSVGIDGISLWLFLLTTFLMPLAVLGSFNAVDKRWREYYFLLLDFRDGNARCICALDIFLFYVFWEAMLIPMYFLMGIWGGKERIYAAMKFFLYTLVGFVVDASGDFLSWPISIKCKSEITRLDYRSL